MLAKILDSIYSVYANKLYGHNCIIRFQYEENLDFLVYVCGDYSEEQRVKSLGCTLYTMFEVEGIRRKGGWKEQEEIWGQKK